MKNKLQNLSRIFLAAVVGVSAASAQAAVTFDTKAVTDAITAGGVAAGVIGAAMLAFYAIKKVWTMIRP